MRAELAAGDKEKNELLKQATAGEEKVWRRRKESRNDVGEAKRRTSHGGEA